MGQVPEFPGRGMILLSLGSAASIFAGYSMLRAGIKLPRINRKAKLRFAILAVPVIAFGSCLYYPPVADIEVLSKITLRDAILFYWRQAPDVFLELFCYI
jgi:hypothetical protein